MLGKIITLEGIDKSGKETQKDLLVEKLRENFGAIYNVRTISFPEYNTLSGNLCRRYQEGEFGDAMEIDPYLSALPYAMNRKHMRDALLLHLSNNGLWVLDRYIESNLAHHGAKIDNPEKRKEFIDFMYRLETKENKMPRADLVLFLDIPAEEVAKIKKENEDQHESNTGYLSDVWDTYDYLCGINQTWRRINCMDGERRRSVEEVSGDIWEMVDRNFIRNN